MNIVYCATKDSEGKTLGEMLLFNKTTPLDFCITNYQRSQCSRKNVKLKQSDTFWFSSIFVNILC